MLDSVCREIWRRVAIWRLAARSSLVLLRFSIVAVVTWSVGAWTAGAQFAGAERMRVNPVRGIVMLVAAAIAFWKGWQIHHGETAVLAYGLGAIALTLGVWHLTRQAPRPRL
jgi:hypothetical protein